MASIGGSLMNFASPDWPGAATATRSPSRECRERNSSIAARTSSTGSASDCESIIGYSMYSNASATSLRGSVGDTWQRRALRPHLPMSIPQAYGLRAIGALFPERSVVGVRAGNGSGATG